MVVSLVAEVVPPSEVPVLPVVATPVVVICEVVGLVESVPVLVSVALKLNKRDIAVKEVSN